MLLSEGKYLKPSKETRVLAILDSLSQDSGLSQYELGRRLKLSGAMVNQYLKLLQEQNLIEYRPVNGKSYRYVLTSGGEKSRRQMFSDYSSETIRLYTNIKDFIANRLRGLEARGRRRIALFGASETCEVVLSALRDTAFQVVAVVDNDTGKHGAPFHRYVISAPVVLEQVDCQAVVITSFGRQDEIHQQLQPLSTRRGLEIVRL
ncbi:Predicted transcriptional regulator, ArsR family [Humidesulfovibrio mexicanus]|uniref:Predicted transcriptional regulator, ArsR family n=1 Tax=Humidesulfovibrio mexicanus TaxID=147047 RepID=A0A238YBF5_9BACT|nr:winged helix-turn-helix transcriptional regulator [Humidesulfovibrio mexicanus]SNR67934.1 Predicted transcriptional regulator, ArsR family [Humidesulfovibrio mexicanus]